MGSTTPPGETTPLTEAHGAPQKPNQSDPTLPAVEPITWSKRCDVVLQAVMCGLFGRAQTGVKIMTPTMHAAWLVEDAVHGLPLVLHGPGTLESVRHSYLIYQEMTLLYNMTVG